MLVFLDLNYGSHWAFFHAVTTASAGVFVDHHAKILDDIQNIIAAGISTDSTASTFFSINYWTRHKKAPFAFGVAVRQRLNDIRVNIT